MSPWRSATRRHGRALQMNKMAGAATLKGLVLRRLAEISNSSCEDDGQQMRPVGRAFAPSVSVV